MNPESAHTSHPDPETILSLFSGRPLAAPDLAVLQHLARCPSCREALSFTAAATARAAATAARPSPLMNAAWHRLARAVALWKQRSDRDADALAAAAGDTRILFRGAPGTPCGREWKAELLLAPISGNPPSFTLRMVQAGGRTPDIGRFVLFGADVPVRAGTASIPVDVFGTATPSGGVAFIAPDGTEIPGVPILGGIE